MDIHLHRYKRWNASTPPPHTWESAYCMEIYPKTYLFQWKSFTTTRLCLFCFYDYISVGLLTRKEFFFSRTRFLQPPFVLFPLHRVTSNIDVRKGWITYCVKKNISSLFSLPTSKFHFFFLFPSGITLPCEQIELLRFMQKRYWEKPLRKQRIINLK